MLVDKINVAEIQDDDVLTFDKYTALDIPKETFLLEPWLINPSYTLLVATRGLGKTWFSLAVAIAVASGTDIVNWTVPEPQGVLYIDGEMSPRQLLDRLSSMGKGVPHLGENLHILSVPRMVREEKEPMNMAQQEWRTQLKLFIGKHPEIKLLIVDNISCLFPGLDENNKQDWDAPDAFFIGLRSIGVSVIVVHHTGKEGHKGQRGSSAHEDHVDVSIRLSGVMGHHPSKGCKITTHFNKSRCLSGHATESTQLDLKCDEFGRDWFVAGEATKLQHEIIQYRKTIMPNGKPMTYKMIATEDYADCSESMVKKTCHMFCESFNIP